MFMTKLMPLPPSEEQMKLWFSLIEYDPDYVVLKNAITETEESKQVYLPALLRHNVIHFSAIPWLNFTSLSHARSYTDSCPKISFGKMITTDDGTKTMAMSIHVHHGLIDGLQLGQFVDYFQEIMNQ
jgi:chloramphenicol O-acetyltransferase type A